MANRSESDTVREQVRERYREAARRQNSGCCCGSTCCGDTSPQEVLRKGKQMGYTAEDLEGVPQGANMALGCGNPSAIAGLEPGESVLDLGSGGGLDCFLAARQVGETGHVIGVDMTPDMVRRARANAAQGGYDNVEFRLGEIEHLPVADENVDVIISNCVINLSPDKQAVFCEAYRVLKPGGRLAISDTVATVPLPPEVSQDMSLWTDCLSGAALIDDLEEMLREAGFKEVCIQPKDESREMVREWASGCDLDEYVLSATIEAVKPAREG